MAKPVQLGSHDILIDAPRELVYQMMTAFNAGPMPGDSNESSRVISSDDDSQIVEFTSRAGFITYTSVEKVTLDAPERITFNHLSGPPPLRMRRVHSRRPGWPNAVDSPRRDTLEPDPDIWVGRHGALHPADVQPSRFASHGDHQDRRRSQSGSQPRLPPETQDAAV